MLLGNSMQNPVTLFPAVIPEIFIKDEYNNRNRVNDASFE